VRCATGPCRLGLLLGGAGELVGVALLGAAATGGERERRRGERKQDWDLLHVDRAPPSPRPSSPLRTVPRRNSEQGYEPFPAPAPMGGNRSPDLRRSTISGGASPRTTRRRGRIAVLGEEWYL